jgi:hypothetical protein
VVETGEGQMTNFSEYVGDMLTGWHVRMTFDHVRDGAVGARIDVYAEAVVDGVMVGTSRAGILAEGAGATWLVRFVFEPPILIERAQTTFGVRYFRIEDGVRRNLSISPVPPAASIFHP